jgi:hypothetical protein
MPEVGGGVGVQAYRPCSIWYVLYQDNYIFSLKKSEVTICKLGKAWIKHAWKTLVSKNESLSAYLKDLKLSKFSHDIWTILIKHITNFSKDTPLCFGKLFFTKISCWFYIKQSLFIKYIHTYTHTYINFISVSRIHSRHKSKYLMTWTDLWNWEPFQNCLLLSDTHILCRLSLC